MSESVYFTDNFFSAGVTDIYNEKQEKIGSLDLKSAFSSSVNVLDENGEIVVKASFPFFSRSWIISNQDEQEIGKLKQRMTFFSKKFLYQSYPHDEYEIKSEAFSKEYEVFDQGGNLVASFKKVSGFFQSPAYELQNHAANLSTEELVAVVMGVNMIIKQNNSSSSANSGTY
ncbi:hypothetical protein VBD025_14750 [Virgibacillus flavescens]|uniref:hypothetical protein n=1 Tax=Virgibacillus flavescens TaxID=1611422 RepID=UPI003D34769E